MMVELPPEILQLIVDALYKPSPLLLVSRVFRHLARKRIFRSIVIRTFPSKRVPHDASLLLDILSAAPDIIQCISCVHLAFRAINWKDDVEYADCWTPKCCTVHTGKPSECPGRNDPNFAKVLYLLSEGCVERLEIANTEGLNLDDKVLDAIIALRTSPSLASLALIRSSNIPLFIINGIPSRDTLTELQLGNVEWWASIDDTFTQLELPHRPPLLNLKEAHDEFMRGVPPFRNLARLTMTHCDWPCIFPRASGTVPSSVPTQIVDHITSIYGSVAFPNLKSLRIEPHGMDNGLDVDDWAMVIDLLSRAPAVEKFSVFSWYSPKLLNGYFMNTMIPVLKNIPQLRSIELTDDPCNFPQGDIFAHRARIIDALQPSAGPLEHVHFGFSFRYYPPSDDEHTDEELIAVLEKCWAAGWMELGRALRQIKTLESVSLALSLDYLPLYEQDFWDRMFEGLREAVVRALNEPKIAVSAISEYRSY